MRHTQTPGEHSPRFATRSPPGAFPGRWAFMVLVLQLAAGSAGCRDGESPTSPVDIAPPAPAADVGPTASAAVLGDLQPGDATSALAAPVSATVAIEDALTRVLPALEAGGATNGLDLALRRLRDLHANDGSDAIGLKQALNEVQKAVDRYEAQAADEFQPDVSALRLALDAAANG